MQPVLQVREGTRRTFPAAANGIDQRKEVEMRFLPRKAVLGMAAIAGLLAISHSVTGAADFARKERLAISREVPPDDTLGLECMAEATAFTEVADLAYVYKEEGDVFAGALFDLREQLLDCLATSSEDPDARSFTPSSEGIKSI
jgi:hypothetical protein